MPTSLIYIPVNELLLDTCMNGRLFVHTIWKMMSFLRDVQFQECIFSFQNESLIPKQDFLTPLPIHDSPP